MSASCLLSKDQFQCCICLDVFTDPVSTSCGHNFCRACINNYWNKNVHCVCPLCNQVFYPKPELKVNMFISKMAAEFKARSLSEQPAAKPRDVQWEALVAAQLQSHHPGKNLEDRMCQKHNKPLALFCMTDQTCVCSLCPVLDHKKHECVPLEEEYERRKCTFRQSVAEIHQKIRQRQQNIEEMKLSAKINKEAADREKAEVGQAFSIMKQHVEKSHIYFIEMVNDKQKITEKQTEDFVKGLQLEISVLMERTAEMKQLLHAEDPILLLQSFPSLSTAPSMKDWTKVSVQQSSYEGIMVDAVLQLEEAISMEVKKMVHAELKRIKQLAVQVSLAPNTTEPFTTLSDEGKPLQVDVKKKRHNNMEKYMYRSVLAKQSFSSGIFYFEVLVKGKCKWAVGVARESTNRRGGITLSPQNGYWVIMVMNDNEILACDRPHVHLSLKSRPDKVGVFVDYEEGLVSFYDARTGSLIFSFIGLSFTNKLRPFSFCLRPNSKSSAPLVSTAVKNVAEKQKSFFGAIRSRFKKKSFDLSKVK